MRAGFGGLAWPARSWQAVGDFMRVGVLAAGVWLAMSAASFAQAGQVFGLAGKSRDDINFVRAAQGCAEEARKFGDQCEHLGGTGAAQVRLQDQALREAIKRPVVGLAVSVIRSDYLAKGALAEAARQRIPVITFDSDLDAAFQPLRRSYVGPDNRAFGRQLGAQAQIAHPGGGLVCLMSGEAHAPNLAQRLQGVREALSGNPAWPPGARLHGEGGWREAERCPWLNGDDPQRALKQLKTALTELQVDAVISVGAWPLSNLDAYRQAMTALKHSHLDANKSVIIAVGTVTPEQQALLRDGLVHALVSIDFAEMGRAVYASLKKAVNGQPLAPFVYTNTLVYTRD
jgi:ribose transport system substrate-binding protein